ncbi:MAG: glutathione S-transferase family protein [Alphaproteobacteria bacterium]|nr:glutathione S-transferase family protein [Alphaproteobacteria bacterium]
MLTLYDYLDSGNGYKVRLLLAHLGRDYTLVEKDIMQGETRTPDYLAMNPNGRIPLLQLEDGSFLAESGAMLNYLAEGTPFLPDGGIDRARVLQWMFFEQYSHEPPIAGARFRMRHKEQTDEVKAEIAALRAPGEAALAVMEGELAARDWFAAGRYTIADIALYAYTHVSDHGGFDLARYPAIGRWLTRVKAQPGWFPMLAPDEPGVA